MRQTFFKTRSSRPSKYFYKMSDVWHKHPYVRKSCLICNKQTMQKTRSKGFCSRACAKVGEFNPNWWPDSIYKQYTMSQMTAFHQAVYKVRGKASRCDSCGTREKRMYHWANITGDYGNVWDFDSLCVPCHYKFDAAKRKAA